MKFTDLVKRGGLWYKKFTDVPFTGKSTGQFQISFKNGKQDGPYIILRSFNGPLMIKGYKKNNKQHGPYVTYHENGQLFNKGTYKDGKLDGPYVSYSEKGRLLFKGTYKDGKVVSD